jgi:integrase
MLKIRKELLITRSASTANRFLAVISAVLNYAHSKDKLSGVPKIPHLAEENERFIWLTQEQADAFIAELPTHLADMSRFSLATGLRRANVTELTWNDIDRNRNIAWIWADAAKGKKHINVPLNEDAMAVIKERYEQKDKDEKSARHPKYVFTYRGNPIFRVTTAAWYKAAKRAGIDPDFTFHGLRHTWASWHVMAGTPLEVLMKLGAWRSLDMVMRYAHLAPNFTANYAGNSKRVPTKSPTPALNQA